MAFLKRTLIVVGVTAVTGAVVWALIREEASALGPMTNPGPISEAHAFLENNCAACHTPFRGVEDANCVVCHASRANRPI